MSQRTWRDTLWGRAGDGLPVSTSSPYNSLTNSFSRAQGGVHTRDLAAAAETGSQVLAACASPYDRGPAAVRQPGWRLVGRRAVI